jgi:hypothetical protein
MPNWSSVLNEIADTQARDGSPFDRVRRKYLSELHKYTNRNVISYYSGFLSKTRIEGIEINDDDKNGFMFSLHEIDTSLGLDLLLHTPGGDVHATISIVNYIKSKFGNDIRAIIPQIAMSGGTMIACSCKEILMGKQSSLGPIDPQFGFIAAANLLAEVQMARQEIIANPVLAQFWNPILSKITPSFITKCDVAIRESQEFLVRALSDNMFSIYTTQQRAKLIAKANELLGNLQGNSHNTHIHLDECINAGLHIVPLEDDNTLQDLVLTIHHCYMHTLSNTSAYKIIENQLGRAHVRLQQGSSS